MERKPVNSSTIKSVGWEDGTLEMEFASGGIYQYENVSKEVFDSFIRSESKGHFFQADIRPSYVCVRLHIDTCGVPREGVSCAEPCSCWCHKQRKDVSNAKDKPEDKVKGPDTAKYAPKKKRLKA
jgi:KTSC domain